MKVLLVISITLISCICNSNEITILSCRLAANDHGVIAKYSNDLLRLEFNNESVEFKGEEIFYNSYSRFQTEYSLISLPDGGSIFRGFDGAISGSSYTYGLTIGGVTQTCASDVVDGFKYASDIFECDTSNALGCSR